LKKQVILSTAKDLQAEVTKMQVYRLIAVLLTGISSTALGSQLRLAAEQLSDAAPDMYTLPELLAAWDDDDDDEDRAKLANDRAAAIKVMNQKYEDADNVVTKATTLYDIGKMHMDQVVYLRSQAVEKYKAALDSWRIGEALTKPEFDDSAVRNELLTISNKLRDFTANYSKDPRAGEVFWMVGSAMARTGNDHYGQYLKQAQIHPKAGDYAAISQLTQADILASQGKQQEAGDQYDALRKQNLPDHLKGYATWRLGWTYLVRAMAEKSPKKDEYLKKAEAAFQLTLKVVKEDGETRFRLKQAALDDLSWMWAWLGNESAAYAFFEKEGHKKAAPAFKSRLADEWLKQGNVAQAAAYFQEEIKKDPELKERPDFHLKLAHAYIAAGDAQGMKNEIDALIKITTDKDDEWYDEHEDDKELMTRATKMHQLLPLTAGFRMIEVANSQKDPKRKKEILTAAIKELTAQAGKAADDERKLAMRVAVVQGQIELEKFPEALSQLDAIVAMGPKAGNFLEKAAFERINIVVKMIESQTFPPVPPPGEVKKPLAVPDIKVRFAAVANDYLKIAPAAENAVNLRYQIANELFTYGHYQESLPLFEGIANDFPRADLGKSAMEIVVSMNLKMENWDELIRLSTSFLNNREVKGKKLREFLKQNLDWAKAQKEQKAG
jgi:tetratricopeptide (TPR) repeat protein